MTRLLLAFALALTLTGCVVAPPDPPQDRYLMYWPYIDGAPVHVDAGDF